jgi:hypothetical protein
VSTEFCRKGVPHAFFTLVYSKCYAKLPKIPLNSKSFFDDTNLSLAPLICLSVSICFSLFDCLPVCRLVSVSLCVCLCLSLCLSLFMSFVCVSFCPSFSVYLSLCLYVSLSMCVSACLSLCLEVSVSVCLSLSVCLSVCFSLFLSVCLRVSLFVCFKDLKYLVCIFNSFKKLIFFLS